MIRTITTTREYDKNGYVVKETTVTTEDFPDVPLAAYQWRSTDSSPSTVSFN